MCDNIGTPKEERQNQMKLKELESQLDTATDRLYAEVRTLQERQAELEKKANTLFVGLLFVTVSLITMIITVALVAGGRGTIG
tara:strand:+ start:157 stop:405 length:249 start_codon:yes stop_codon:yes gene_type:complete